VRREESGGAGGRKRWDIRGVDVTEEGVFVGDQRWLVR